MKNKFLKIISLICLTLFILQEKVPANNISLDANLFFEKYNYELKPESYTYLEKIAKIILLENKICIIEIKTAKFPNPQPLSEWELSMIRADRIVDYILNNYNLVPERIYTIGFGTKFTKNKDFPDDRIDIIFKPNTKQLLVEDEKNDFH